MTIAPPVPFDSSVTEADVVVVGSGGAGLTSALVAALNGLSVIVLEKAGQLGGTTAMSGGGVWAPLNSHEMETGVDDSYDKVIEYLRGITGDDYDDSMLVAYAKNAAAMIETLEKKGGLSFRSYPIQGSTWDYRSEVPGARQGGRGVDSGPVELAPLGEWVDLIRMGRQSAWTFDKFIYYANSMHALPPAENARPVLPDLESGKTQEDIRPKDVVANGTALVTQLLRGCLEQGVRIFPATPVKKLNVDDGRVTGVDVELNGGTQTVRATRGVVLATGGYTHNLELRDRFLHGRTINYTCDVESNRGDGLLMGIEVGAAVANTGDAWWIPCYLFTDPQRPDLTGSMIREERCLPHTMIVDGTARRFANESKNYNDMGASFESNDGESHLPAFMIFDTQALKNYAMFRAAPWPADGSTPSWLLSADSLEELAAKCGIDAEVFGATVAEFNEGARMGVDPLFHRGESEWDRTWGDEKHEPNPALGPVEVGPFYALSMTPGVFSTKGGVKLNDRGQVLAEATGEPIEGLYAAGNVSNDALPEGYPGVGGTLGPAMTFGYIIGQQLASK
jgi:3-oxosteroid 1-dehydrogenase